MGKLHEAVQVVEKRIEAKGLDINEMRGKIGLKAGFFLVIVNENSPDDPEKINALRSAAAELLGEKMPF